MDLNFDETMACSIKCGSEDSQDKQKYFGKGFSVDLYMIIGTIPFIPFPQNSPWHASLLGKLFFELPMAAKMLEYPLGCYVFDLEDFVSLMR